MKTRTFTWILFCVTAAGVIATLAHLAYAMHAYEHCSIIYFIAKELW